jgi:hypothetical protein
MLYSFVSIMVIIYPTGNRAKDGGDDNIKKAHTRIV